MVVVDMLMKNEDTLDVQDYMCGIRAANIEIVRRKVSDVKLELSSQLGLLRADLEYMGAKQNETKQLLGEAIALIEQEERQPPGVIVSGIVVAVSAAIEVKNSRFRTVNSDVLNTFNNHLKAIIYCLLGVAEVSLDEAVRESVVRLAAGARKSFSPQHAK